MHINDIYMKWKCWLWIIWRVYTVHKDKCFFSWRHRVVSIPTLQGRASAHWSNRGNENPLSHLHEDEAPVQTDKLTLETQPFQRLVWKGQMGLETGITMEWFNNYVQSYPQHHQSGNTWDGPNFRSFHWFANGATCGRPPVPPKTGVTGRSGREFHAVEGGQNATGGAGRFICHDVESEAKLRRFATCRILSCWMSQK